jgi:hypothetical protein
LLRRSLPVLLLLALLWPGAKPAAALKPAAPLELSLYYAVDLRKDGEVRELERVWRRAAAAGYTRVMLADVHFANPGAMDGKYRANAARVRSLAARIGLAIVPGVFQVGRSNVMLGCDPNLAEGVPVRRARFVVRGGEARLVADPPVSLAGRPEWNDPAVKLVGAVAVTSDNAGRARFRLRVRVAPFRCYRVSVKVRSRGFSGAAQISALGGRQLLDFIRPLDILPTQDWRRYDIVFNSLDHRELEIYLGLWKAARGRLEWTDWRIEEVGLLNVLRRAGAPCVVEGRVEGRDYEFIRDPDFDRVRGKGDYSEWHEPPRIRTRLPDGTELRVSWYHPAFFYGGSTTCCPADPGTFALLRDEAARLRELWGASGHLMMHNEIRCLGWDASCAAQGKSAGEVLAAHLRRCRSLLAGTQVYAWSDMFDPLHNAHAGYYLVRGDLARSWEGLDRDVIILNWNSERRAESLRLFSRRGQRQIIAGYYDSDPGDILDALAAARGVPGVTGVMYTTWQGRYDDLERFAQLVRGAEWD